MGTVEEEFEPLAGEDESVHEAEADLSDVERLAAAIVERDGTWRSGETIAFTSLRWRPDLVRDPDGDNPGAVLHVHLAERLRPYVVERMRAAGDAGYDVHLALPLASLYDEELLLGIHDLDPLVHVIRDAAAVAIGAPDALLSLLCTERVRVSATMRTALASQGLELSKHGSRNVRGRRYEGMISFLLSQVADFDVVERNLRTDTEELDAVVQLRSTHGRVWTGLGAPLVLVEAKNWRDPVPQKEVSAFRVKMDGRRQTVRLGLMFGANGFTSDALDQELRFASDELTIAFIGPDELDEWIVADDGGDDLLETLVRRAMLR